jgi:hypothetical protein
MLHNAVHISINFNVNSTSFPLFSYIGKLPTTALKRALQNMTPLKPRKRNSTFNLPFLKRWTSFSNKLSTFFPHVDYFDTLHGAQRSRGPFSITAYLQGDISLVFRTLKPVFIKFRDVCLNDVSTIHSPLVKKSPPPGGGPTFRHLISAYSDKLNINVDAICPRIDKETVEKNDNTVLSNHLNFFKPDFIGTNRLNGRQIVLDYPRCFNAASIASRLLLGTHEIPQVSKQEILSFILSKDTSSGLPFRIKKNLLNYEDTLDLLEKVINDFRISHLLSLGSVIAHRYQVVRNGKDGLYSHKSRIIFVVDIIFLVLQAYLFFGINKRFLDRAITQPLSCVGLNPTQL